MKKESYLNISHTLLMRTDLTPGEKILLAEILSILKINGSCFASTNYFRIRTGMSERTIYNNFNSLTKKEFISFDNLKSKKRHININYNKIKATIPDKEYEKITGRIEKFADKNENISAYNNNYNNKYKNNYKKNNTRSNYSDCFNQTYMDESSYDLAELMVIR